MPYSFILSALDGTPTSELAGAKSRRYSVALSGQATASLTVRLDHPDAGRLLTGDNLLRVYDDRGVLSFHGRQVSAEEVAGASGDTVAAAFADPLWVLASRLIGKSPTGYSNTGDRGAIMADVLAQANALGPSGVRLGTVVASSSTTVAGWTYKPASEALAELGAGLSAPEWRIVPEEYGAGAAGAYGRLDVSPVLGQLRADAVWEYGDGLLNVGGYKRTVTMDGVATRLYSLPPGFPESATQGVLQADAPGSQAVRGFLEAALPSDLTVDALRSDLLGYNRDVRQSPRQVITFDPARDLTGVRVPRLGTDYTVGDVVPFRASVPDLTRAGAFRKRIDVLVRVYNAEVTVDDEGAASLSLTVTPSA